MAGICLQNLARAPLLSISTDRVDEEELQKPRNWNIGFIGRFTAFFGGISSIFDFITMAFLFLAARSNVPLFRTGWFIESTLSEILVTFTIRTNKKFYRSRPSAILLIMSVVCGALTVILPYSPIGEVFQFYPPDTDILLAIFGILAMYFSAVELTKHFFQRKYAEKQRGSN